MLLLLFCVITLAGCSAFTKRSLFLSSSLEGRKILRVPCGIMGVCTKRNGFYRAFHWDGDFDPRDFKIRRPQTAMGKCITMVSTKPLHVSPVSV